MTIDGCSTISNYIIKYIQYHNSFFAIINKWLRDIIYKRTFNYKKKVYFYSIKSRVRQHNFIKTDKSQKIECMNKICFTKSKNICLNYYTW